MYFNQQIDCPQNSSTKHFPQLLFSLKSHFTRTPHLKIQLSYILDNIVSHLCFLLWWALFSPQDGMEIPKPSFFLNQVITWIPKSFTLRFKIVFTIMESLICKCWLSLVTPNQNASQSKFCRFCSWRKSEAGQRLQNQFVTENDLVIDRLNLIED